MGKNVLFGCLKLLWRQRGTRHQTKPIFPDQEILYALTNAIAEVFPKHNLVLCEWHISKHAAQNVSHLYAKHGFKDVYQFH